MGVLYCSYGIKCISFNGRVIEIFSKIASKKEGNYLFFAVGVPVGLYSVSAQQIWLYVMAFMIFLSMYFFRKGDKKEHILNFIGLVLICAIIFAGEKYV